MTIAPKTSPKTKFIETVNSILNEMRPDYIYIEIVLKTIEKRYFFLENYQQFIESDTETIITEQWTHGPKTFHNIRLEDIKEIGYPTKHTTHAHWEYVDL